MDSMIFALWFFLAAGIANMVPILASKAPYLRTWNAPVDGGRSFRGVRILGNHKTWRGIVSGVLVGTLVVYAQVWIFEQSIWLQGLYPGFSYSDVSVLALGVALSAGALGGDALKSFFKRQIGVSSGKSWFPFDQLDYIIGAGLLSALVVALPLVYYLWIVVLWFGLHLLFSYIGYLLRLKDAPI